MMPKTGSKKFRQKLKDIKVWLYANRDQKLKKLMGMLNLKLTGHYRYREVSVCSPNPFIKRYTISTTPAQLIRAKARAIEIVNHSLIYA